VAFGYNSRLEDAPFLLWVFTGAAVRQETAAHFFCLSKIIVCLMTHVKHKVNLELHQERTGVRAI
jgi:hypothetical protein